MTLNQRYYAVNTAINTYLQSKGIDARVIKYGIDPATLANQSLSTAKTKYPYFQSYITNVQEQPWTTETTGIFTDFDYQLSYFAGPQSEKINDTKYFYPFEVVKNVLGDINLNILDGIADIRSKEGPYKFEVKSGQPVASAIMIYKMRAQCSYEAIIPDAGITTDINSAISIIGE